MRDLFVTHASSRTECVNYKVGLGTMSHLKPLVLLDSRTETSWAEIERCIRQILAGVFPSRFM
jgi:hypothetical protein